MFFGVGLAEEFCKLAVVLFVFKQTGQPAHSAHGGLLRDDLEVEFRNLRGYRLSAHNK